MGIDNIGFFSLAYSLTRNLNELRTEFYKSRQTNKNLYVIASDVCCMLCTFSCLRVRRVSSSAGLQRDGGL